MCALCRSFTAILPNAFRSCSSKPLPPHKLTGNTHTYIDRESVAHACRDRDDAHIRNCTRASHIRNCTRASQGVCSSRMHTKGMPRPLHSESLAERRGRSLTPSRRQIHRTKRCRTTYRFSSTQTREHMRILSRVCSCMLVHRLRSRATKQNARAQVEWDPQPR